MAYYAQKNYNQDLIGSQFTIAQGGSLLTAFANLLQRYGITMDPPKLDNYLSQQGSGPDLSWSSIALVDKLISVDQIGGTEIPVSPDTIVKFHHQSVTTPTVLIDGQEVPNMVDHFCAVDRIASGQLFIIDSADGLIKSPMTYEHTYGKPLAWASYQEHLPVPAEPSKKIMHGRVAAPPKVMYNVILEVPGYVTAQQALNHGTTASRVVAGKYYVWHEQDGMKNLSTVYGRPGMWINPKDNNFNAPMQPRVQSAPSYNTYTVIRELEGYSTATNALDHIQQTNRLSPGTYYTIKEDMGMLLVTVKPGATSCWINPEDNVVTRMRQAEPAPVPAHAATEANTVSESDQGTQSNWKGSYKAFPKQPTNFYATKTFIVHDLDQKRPDTTAHRYDLCPLAGTFVGPDGVLYGRTMASTFPSARKNPAARELPPFYYGLDVRYLMSEEEVWNTQTDIVTRAATHNLSFHDHLAIALGRFTGWLERLGKQKDITKKG